MSSDGCELKKCSPNANLDTKHTSTCDFDFSQEDDEGGVLLCGMLPRRSNQKNTNSMRENTIFAEKTKYKDAFVSALCDYISMHVSNSFACVLPACVFLALTCADGHVEWIVHSPARSAPTMSMGCMAKCSLILRCAAEAHKVITRVCMHAQSSRCLWCVASVSNGTHPLTCRRVGDVSFGQKMHYSYLLFEAMLWAFCKCDLLCLSPCQFGSAHTKKQCRRCWQSLPAKLAMLRKTQKSGN